MSKDKKIRIYSEGKDSTFTSNGKTYSLDGLFRETHKYSITILPISKLDWVFEYATPDPDRVVKADEEVPILVVRDLHAPAGQQFIVVDGLHRLMKAVSKRRNTIKTKLISKPLLDMFEIR